MTATWVSVLASYLHLLAAAVYVGGSVAMELVVRPAQRFVPPAQAQVIGQRAADRFLVLVWSALALFPISGILLFFSLGDQHTLAGGRIFTTSYGQTLLAMMLLWVVLVINGAIITFVFRPRLLERASARAGGRAASEHVEALQSAARWVSYITRADLAIALFIVLLGASMAYGHGLF